MVGSIGSCNFELGELRRAQQVHADLTRREHLACLRVSLEPRKAEVLLPSEVRRENNPVLATEPTWLPAERVWGKPSRTPGGTYRTRAGIVLNVVFYRQAILVVSPHSPHWRFPGRCWLLSWPLARWHRSRACCRGIEFGFSRSELEIVRWEAWPAKDPRAPPPGSIWLAAANSPIPTKACRYY